MRIDKTAFCQGVINAETEHVICRDLATKIYNAVHSISYRGPVGRSVCDYDKLLVELSKIEAPWIEWSLMWKHLGEWMSSGISVGADQEGG